MGGSKLTTTIGQLDVCVGVRLQLHRESEKRWKRWSEKRLKRRCSKEKWRRWSVKVLRLLIGSLRLISDNEKKPPKNQADI